MPTRRAHHEELAAAPFVLGVVIYLWAKFRTPKT
jgi:hypothetical protein